MDKDGHKKEQIHVLGQRKYSNTGKGGSLVLRCLTLPHGRLQFSRAVSTRFLSAENILKILRRHKHTPFWVITEDGPETVGFSLWARVSNCSIHHSFQLAPTVLRKSCEKTLCWSRKQTIKRLRHEGNQPQAPMGNYRLLHIKQS